jgi:hypothetical protein
VALTGPVTSRLTLIDGVAVQFRPQNPGLLHMPLGQTGASLDRAAGPLACAEKVENSWVRCFSPHEGQFTSAVSEERRSSFSNFVPQS